MEIADIVTRGTACLTELADLVIGDVPTNQPNHVTITTGQRVLLDNYYYSINGEIHLDLRNLVLTNTYMSVPGLKIVDGEPVMYTGAESAQTHTAAVLPLAVTVTNLQTTNNYTFTAYPFDVFPVLGQQGTFIPAIDELRIPEDYILPLSVFMVPGMHSTTQVQVSVQQGGAQRQRSYYFTNDLSRGTMISQLVTIDDLVRARLLDDCGVPFALSIEFGSRILWTPLLRIVKQKMEQYAFLSREGIYYNIPMPGRLWYKPEFDISVLRGSGNFETAAAEITDLHEQNSGPLTRKAAMSLATYLISRDVWHYDRGVELWRRIVIESPSVNIANRGGVYALTFQWRYADGIVNY